MGVDESRHDPLTLLHLDDLHIFQRPAFRQCYLLQLRSFDLFLDPNDSSTVIDRNCCVVEELCFSE